MTLSNFLNKLATATGPEFEETQQVITDLYHYTPAAFSNGDIRNEAGQNEGSCKIFAFAKDQQLSEESTLRCFGRFYQDVLNTPEGTDHGNIRNFMHHGWDGIHFESQALTPK
ncbi:HopJ type III effector protein [Oceanospirillum linum]|uniref:Type III effector n=1 Tax=Oceanospirillum linum TaxID=966 RepID=A0A1T1HCD1_OCELI|nr:HopJ type III effector protein [Oceanospirillum linum]OOV87485.1 type III effector [Oceanospirillum linum]SEF89464.1 HopJ type III effector protein [Oleiphilus messinensis]SMP13625.1 HopJ type III effector protein [Oceanospirillum linum]